MASAENTAALSERMQNFYAATGLEPTTLRLQGKCLTDQAKKVPIDFIHRNQNSSKSNPNFDFQSKISA